MFTKIDKTWTALLVSFVSATCLQFFGFGLDPMVQGAIVSVVTAALTWLVPNKQ